MSVAYRIVQRISDKWQITDTPDIIAWALANDINVIGVRDDQRVRAELRNQPILQGFHGPAHDGEGIVRYEDWETYNLLSMD
jgi:hypothetical protein